jgi:hypothetical protein
VPTLDDSRDNDIRPDEVPADDASEKLPPGEPPRSPFEPPRGDSEQAPSEEAPGTPPDELQPDAPVPRESPPEPEDDVFARLNAPPGEDAGEAEPPFVVTERDLGAGEEPRAPSKAATFVAFLVVVLAVIGIMTTIASVKLFTERNEMSAALEQSAERLATVYAGPGATDTSRRRIAWLQDTIEEGDYAQAQKAIESLGTPEVERPSPLDTPDGQTDGAHARPDAAEGGGEGRPQLPRPEQDESLPVEAQAFFEQHPELWEAFFGFSVAIKRMEQAEVPVGDFVTLRSEMVDAAEAGDAQKVESLLNQAREQIEGQSGNRVPQGLKQRLEKFRSAIQQAQKERRDVRAAVALAKQSERAAQQGDIARAEKLMDRAIAAVENAPRMARRPQRPPSAAPGARGMPRMGPQIGFIKFVAELTTDVLKAEERDLAEIWESINIAAGAIREKNAEQIREILGEAKEAFRDIGDRRREMSAAIQRAQQKVRQAQAGQEPPERPEAGPSEEEQRKRQQIVMQRVATILARVRAMPEAEFEANQAEIAQAVLQAMSAPVQSPMAEQFEQLSPEERVREKMRLAGEMYRKLRDETDVDTTELDEKFAKVRDLITEHEYERAETLVDEGVAMMRDMAQGVTQARPEDAAEDTEGYGPQLRLDAPSPSLQLRPDAGDARAPELPADAPVDAPETDLPAAPEAVDIPDDTNEGDEQ